ncbi:MAG: helix-turn-helix domain-containing protein [Acetobacteraceae bacterium]
MSLITPLAESPESVTLSRADYEALLSAAEDAAAAAAADRHREHEARVGWEQARRGYLTAEEARRLLRGENAVKVWREKRGLSQRALAASAGVAASYLAEIEAARKPGSVGALVKLARALEVRIDDLAASDGLHQKA